jgi:hypothetical protein
MGGLDGTTLVYQLIRGKRSNLAFYDVATRRALHTPAALTTKAWEWSPTISGHEILFGRGNPENHRADRQVLLFDLTTGRTTMLATTRGGAYSVVPGQVNGDYAVYWQCFKLCSVLRYRISTGERVRVPSIGRQQYAPSVTRAGTVYFARSGFGCGSGVRLFRFRNGAVTRVASFRAGIDVGRTFAWTGRGGPTTVYFDRTRCTPPHIDVYKLIDPG